MGMNVEERHIPYEELSEFDEVGNCGTAAVCTPIGRIDDLDNGRVFEYDTVNPGPWTTKLYNKLRGIQYGTEPDTHGWCEIIEFDK